MRLTQRMQGQPLFRDWILLDQEKHEQEQNCAQLLVAQPDLDRQCEHGVSLIQRWRARQLLKVGICRAPCKGACSWLTANGLERRQLAREGFLSGLLPFTLSRVVARQLGLLAQVRYPARGSARVTPMKHNLK